MHDFGYFDESVFEYITYIEKKFCISKSSNKISDRLKIRFVRLTGVLEDTSMCVFLSFGVPLNNKTL